MMLTSLRVWLDSQRKKAIETTEADSDWQSCQSEWTRVMEENEGLKSRILLLEHELSEKVMHEKN